MAEASLSIQQWETAKDLFARAMEQAAGDHIPFLESAIAEEPDVQEMVYRLLCVSEPANRFFAHLCQEIGSAATAQHASLPGDILASRFQIVRFLASGGMGEVYAARDLELNVDVALKILRPSMAGRPGMLEQFRSEIRLARTISSPHVCRVYDVARHGFSAGDEISFFTMELLHGETLRERVKRLGPLTEQQAGPLVRQMADGLAAAHRHEVLHRDFKSSNVMICDPDTDGARVAITDFGLARPLASSDLDTSDAATPAYVAPEQLERAAESPATDIYSFGIVLYEMMTGKLPFDGRTAIEVARKRLTEAPPRPRKLNPNLSPRWETTILRCLELDPSRRFQTAVAVAEALGCYGASRQIARRTFWISGVSVAFAGAAWWRNSAIRSHIPEASIAVMPFETQNPDLQYLADGIADRLADQLTLVPGLRVIARSASLRAQALHRNLTETAGQMHVRFLLSGVVRGTANRQHISAEILDGSTATRLAALTEDIGPLEFERFTTDLTRTLIRALHLDAQPASIKQSVTDSPEAYQLYLLGRYYAAQRSRKSLGESVLALERAVQLDPKFTLAYAMLGHAYFDLSQRDQPNWRALYAKSIAAAGRALKMDSQLAEGYLVFGCNKATWEWDWPGAEASFRQAIDLNRGVPETHQFYAILLSVLGRHTEALTQIGQALELDPLNPALQVARGAILTSAGRQNEALQQLRSVVRTNPEYENVYVPMADALEGEGLLNEALAACQRAAALTGGASYAAAASGRLLGLLGWTDMAKQILRELQERYARNDAYASDVAQVYLGLGDKDHAFEWLERAYASRDPDVPALKIGKEYEILRSDQRYANLIARLKL